MDFNCIKYGDAKPEKGVAVAYVSMLILSTIGDRFGSIEAGGEGSGETLRQILYLAILSQILFFHGKSLWHGILQMDLALAALLALCLISSIWAIDPFTAMKRSLFTALVVVIVYVAVNSSGVSRIWNITVTYIAASALLSIVLAICAPSIAVHLDSDDIDPTVVGAWHGVYQHKNISGPVSAIGVLMLALPKYNRGLFYIPMGFACVVLLIASGSRTSLACFCVALAFGFMLRYSASLAMKALLLFLSALCLTAAYVLIYRQNDVGNYFAQPENLNGRAQIWPFVWEYAQNHPWTGSGYGSFWKVGDVSPILQLPQKWLEAVPNAHNGYIDLAVQIGFPGLALGVFALFIEPLIGLMRNPDAAALGPVWLFVISDNITESTLLNRDLLPWVIFVLIRSAILAR